MTQCNNPQQPPILIFTVVLGLLIPIYNKDTRFPFIKAYMVLFIVTFILNLITVIVYFFQKFWWGAFATFASTILTLSYLSGMTWDLNRSQQVIIAQLFITVFQTTVFAISIISSQEDNLCNIPMFAALPLASISFQFSSLVYFVYRIFNLYKQHNRTLMYVPDEARSTIRLHRYNIPEKFQVKLPWLYFTGKVADHVDYGLQYVMNISTARNIPVKIQQGHDIQKLIVVGRNTIQLDIVDDDDFQQNIILVQRKQKLSQQHRMDLIRYYTMLSTPQDKFFTIKLHRHEILKDFMSELLRTPLEHHVYDLKTVIAGSDSYNPRTILVDCLSTVAFKLFTPFLNNKDIDDVQSIQSFSILNSNENDSNSFVNYSEQNTIIMSSDISSSHAYLMGWIIGKCLLENVQICAPLSKLFLALTTDLPPTISDVADYDSSFKFDLVQAEIDDHQFHQLVNSIGNVKHQIIKVKNSELRLHAIDIAHAVQLKFYAGNAIKLQALRLGFRNAIPQPADFYLDSELLFKKLVGSSKIDVEDWQKFTIFVDFPGNSQISVWFFEILREKVKFCEFVLRLATGLRCVPQGGFEELGRAKFSGVKKVLFQVQRCDLRVGVQGGDFGVFRCPDCGSKGQLERLMEEAKDSMIE
ncbi:Ubiquitin-protein ligase WWP1 [Spironucleus salmonicida]|uniref:HECT E3 ubiquitin-protein ligase n=1 Tax=Spironucleus salmonicida TaxID=348837 RepID=V6LYU4_9EUKA|nr:Ubiquitin-protein ligase WWP1 [Spironucleus salmonicida]|eukprot:EST45999.1 HECT E3 ubiquitin-protein ligase [Spironucleus salmonicida]